MSKKIATISYEKEISDFDYNNLFNSLKSKENIELFSGFKGQIFNSKVKCKNCKTLVKDMVFSNITVCPCCYETIYRLVEKKKLKPTLLYSDFIKRILTNDYNNYKGKVPEYTKEYFKNRLKIYDLKRELEHCIETEEYNKCEVLKNIIDELEIKNFKLRRSINE